MTANTHTITSRDYSIPACWRLGWLISCTLAGLLVYASWVNHASPLQHFWQHLDEQTFFLLNGSLAENHAWAVLWGILNNRMFDTLIGLLFTVHYVRYMRQGGHADFERRACQVGIAVVIGILASHLGSDVIEFSRHSPSHELQPSNLLSVMVPWAHPKDYSGSSFPGDHGSVAMMMAVFIWYLRGWKSGILACCITLFALTPRLFAGAHWLTDVMVGSLSITLVVGALLLATPLYAKLVELSRKLLAHLPRAEGLARRMVLYRLATA